MTSCAPVLQCCVWVFRRLQLRRPVMEAVAEPVLKGQSTLKKIRMRESLMFYEDVRRPAEGICAYFLED